MAYNKFFKILILLFFVSPIRATSFQLTSFADIVEPLMPTVVNIYTVKHNETSESPKIISDILPLDKLNKFFEQFNIPFSPEQLINNTNIYALGSGFIVDEAGYIVTNDHVVAGSDEVFVKLSDNREVAAKIVGTDPKTDLALLKIDIKEELPNVNFADSGKLRVGDIVIAIGNPLGFGGTVTTGIISSKGRDLSADPEELVDDFIQTDAAINTGNSGGPLFNINGEVIGLNTALPEASGGMNIGIGFAIPSNTVKDIVNQLKSKGKITRGKLDIAVQQVTPELIEALSLKKNYGVLVVSVKAGGAGENAGLKHGDLITEFNGQAVLSSRKLQLFVADCHIGDTVNLDIIREDKPLKLTAQILDNSFSMDKSSADELYEINDIVFSSSDQNVVVKENKNNQLDFQAGDIIISADKEAVKNISQLENIYNNAQAKAKQALVILIKRKDFNMFSVMPVQAL